MSNHNTEQGQAKQNNDTIHGPSDERGSTLGTMEATDRQSINQTDEQENEASGHAGSTPNSMEDIEGNEHLNADDEEEQSDDGLSIIIDDALDMEEEQAAEVAKELMDGGDFEPVDCGQSTIGRHQEPMDAEPFNDPPRTRSPAPKNNNSAPVIITGVKNIFGPKWYKVVKLDGAYNWVKEQSVNPSLLREFQDKNEAIKKVEEEKKKKRKKRPSYHDDPPYKPPEKKRTPRPVIMVRNTGSQTGINGPDVLLWEFLQRSTLEALLLLRRHHRNVLWRINYYIRKTREENEAAAAKRAAESQEEPQPGPSNQQPPKQVIKQKEHEFNKFCQPTPIGRKPIKMNKDWGEGDHDHGREARRCKSNQYH